MKSPHTFLEILRTGADNRSPIHDRVLILFFVPVR